MNRIRIVKPRSLVLCAIFAALSALLSQISIPIGAVPVNMTHLSVFLAAGLLGAKRGLVSQLVFVLIGAAGLPVFSGFSGGLGVLLGPTGGFIAGYLACVFIAGFIMDKLGRSLYVILLAMAAGWLVTYALGIFWFMRSLHMGLLESLAACFFPFIPGDAVKTALGAVLIRRLSAVSITGE